MIPKPWASSRYRRASCSRARAAKARRAGGLPVIEVMPSMQSSRGPLIGHWSSRRAAPPVGLGAGDRPGPAGMGAPAGQVGRHLGDLLEVEVEPEVVAGGEVDQPVAVDLDPPAVDLLDDGVGHGVL